MLLMDIKRNFGKEKILTNLKIIRLFIFSLLNHIQLDDYKMLFSQNYNKKADTLMI